MAAAGVTKGCNPPANSRYCPDRVVTRGQMAAFLARALGLPSAATDFFTDDNSSLFEGDINRLAAFGITRGCNPPTNDRYCPDREVSRETAFRVSDLALSGQDLMRELGLGEGPEIGRLLRRLLDHVLEEGGANTRDALLREAHRIRAEESSR